MIQFRLLGPVELRDGSGNDLDAVLRQPKRLALLAYLAATPERQFQSRDGLLCLFWPELDTAHARAALSQSVYFLRRELGADVIVSRGPEDLAVDSARLWCDVREFRLRLDRGDRAGALDLYRGALLSGPCLVDSVEWLEWLDGERAALQRLASEASWALAEQAARERQVVEAVRWGRHAFWLAGDDEFQFRRLVELFIRVGDRAGAIRAYEEFAERFRREYQLELSPASRELIEVLQAPGGMAEGWSRAVPAMDRPVPTVPAWSGAVHPETQVVPRRRSRWLVGGTAALVLALLVGWQGVWSRIGTSGSGQPPAVDETSPGRLAVLPFANLSPEPDEAWIADGLTDQVIAELRGLRGLRVIGRGSVMRYRDGPDDLAQVKRTLAVDYVLRGGVRRSDDRVRVTLQLVDAGSGRPFWTDDYEASLSEVAAVPRRIAEGVAAALPGRVTSADRAGLVRGETADPEAHLLYLRGRFLLGHDDAASFAQARDYFEQSLRRDPAYARALSGLADALDRQVWAGSLTPAQAYPRARAAAERALELNPDLAEAHASLARALTAYEWNSEAAETHFRRAIELEPSNARARQLYGTHLLHHGKFDQARQQLETALELDPLSFFSHFSMVILAFFERRYEEASERVRRLADFDPDYAMVHFMDAKIRMQQQQYRSALQILDRIDPQRRIPPFLATRGYIHGVTGEMEEARRILDSLTARARPGSNAFDRGIVLLGMGQRERAMDAFLAAVEQRDWRVRLLGQEPMFEVLRGEPRYPELLQRAGLTPVGPDSP